MKRLCWAQARLTMKDRLTSAKIDPATGRALPAGVEYRGKGQYRARKRSQAESGSIKPSPRPNWPAAGWTRRPPSWNSDSLRTRDRWNVRLSANWSTVMCARRCRRGRMIATVHFSLHVSVFHCRKSPRQIHAGITKIIRFLAHISPETFQSFLPPNTAFLIRAEGR